ncbi:hypothetical protein [uncultured Acetobacteroides sp.]|uniref:hypothetical protein n=1 Tax=uncultured Acetobacteroides sp. TaxID=1760811 RepID=UPI0029F4D9A0|nr:hypothetical protein [uncultured Acetobacteroides sp.]
MKKQSTSESGHETNVDNLDLLISTITSYGEKYNPAKASIFLAALKAKAKEARAAVVVLNDCNTVLNRATIERNKVFAPLGPLVTSSLNALRASDSDEQTDKAAAAIVRKLRGSRAEPVKKQPAKAEQDLQAKPGEAAAPAKAKTTSVSQKSMESIADNFERYVQFLAGTPEYAPNEEAVKLVTLKALAADLRAKNTACNNAKVASDKARNTRNLALYEPIKGMVDVALDAKTYIKSLFGPTSPEYKQVAKIEFTKA